MPTNRRGALFSSRQYGESPVASDEKQPDVSYFNDQEALEKTSFPFTFLMAEALTAVITNHYAMFREEHLDKQIPQAKNLFFWLSSAPKAINIYPKSVSSGPFDFEYPVDPYLSRVRNLKNGKGERPELFGSNKTLPQDTIQSPKFISFYNLMQKFKNKDCTFVKRENDTIIFTSQVINSNLARCSQRLNGKFSVEFRVDFSTPVEDSIRKAFITHAPEYLENTNFILDELVTLKESLLKSEQINQHFQLQARIFKNQEIEKEWYDVQILADEKTGLRIRSDIDDFTRSINPQWLFSTETIDIMSGDEKSESEKLIRHIHAFLQSVNDDAFAYHKEPVAIVKLRKNIISGMLNEIAGNSLDEKADNLYRNFAQGLPIGSGSALNIVYAEIKHFLTRELLKRQLPEALLDQLGPELFTKATNLTRHQTDSNYDPKESTSKVGVGAPENVGGLAPLKSAVDVLKEKTFDEILSLDASQQVSLFHQMVRYIRAVDADSVGLLALYFRWEEELSCYEQRMPVSKRYTLPEEDARFSLTPPTRVSLSSNSSSSSGSSSRSPRNRTVSWDFRRASLQVSQGYQASRFSHVGQVGLLPPAIPASDSREKYIDLGELARARKMFARQSTIISQSGRAFDMGLFPIQPGLDDTKIDSNQVETIPDKHCCSIM